MSRLDEVGRGLGAASRGGGKVGRDQAGEAGREALRHAGRAGGRAAAAGRAGSGASGGGGTERAGSGSSRTSTSATYAAVGRGRGGVSTTAAAAGGAGSGSLRSPRERNVDITRSRTSKSGVVRDGLVRVGDNSVEPATGKVARKLNRTRVAVERDKLGTANALDDGKVGRVVARGRRRVGRGGVALLVSDGDAVTGRVGAVATGKRERGEGSDGKTSVRGARLEEGSSQ